MSVLEMRRVSRVYGQGAAEVRALQDVDLEVGAGTMVAVMGPSGSGKSTLLTIAGSLEDPTSGVVRVCGEELAKLSRNARARLRRRSIGYVFQDFNLLPGLTAAENVALPLELDGINARKARTSGLKSLEELGLADRADRYPDQLSGGERQRVALARALVTEPRVLLLDEPFGALDLKLRKQMQVETKKLQERLGITFIFVTHDQEEALTMSNVIGVINRGRVEQLGNSQAIYERPATRFVASFIGDANILSGTVDSLNDRRATVVQSSRRLVAAADGFAPGQEVYVSVRPEKVRVGGAAEACANRFEGTVVDQVYVGQASKVTVQLEDGERLVATVQISDIGQSVPVGSRLAIGWNPENAVVIPKPAEDEEVVARRAAKAERAVRKKEAAAAKRFGLAVRVAVFLGIPLLVAGIIIGLTVPDAVTSLLGYAVGIGGFAATLAFLGLRLLQARRVKARAATS